MLIKCSALLLVLLSGCAAQRGSATALRSEEVRFVVWLVEDLAHALPRDPRALDADDASPGRRRVALWLTGSESGEGEVQAGPIRTRAARWPLLQPALRSGQAQLERGLLRFTLPDPESQALFADMIQAENADRTRSIDLLKAMAEATPGSALEQQMQKEIEAARQFHLKHLR